MKLSSNFPIILLFSIFLYACSEDNAFNPKLPNSQTIEAEKEADVLHLPLSIVQNMTEEAKQRWLSSLIISEHTYIKDNQYYIDLSETEANALGVPSSYYFERLNHQDSLNLVIQEMLNDGSTLDLIDLKQIVRRVKQTNGKDLIKSDKFSISRGAVGPEGFPVLAQLESYLCRRDTVEMTNPYNESIINITCECDLYGNTYKPEIKSDMAHVEAYSPLYHDKKIIQLTGLDARYVIYLVAKPTKVNRTYTLSLLSASQYLTALFYYGLLDIY